MNFDIQAQNKAVYKFNEVTSITGVKPYVLRFWETEFSQIRPKLNESGQKIYRSEDIELVQKIKKLLFEDKLSIPEARVQLEVPTISSEAIKEEKIDSVKSRSEDLKAALEQIIEKNSRPLSDIQEKNAYELKAEELTDKIRSDVKSQSQLADKDIVNLVTAKKKLSVLLGKIDAICEQRNWN